MKAEVWMIWKMILLQIITSKTWKIQDAANDISKRISEDLPTILELQKSFSLPSLINKISLPVDHVRSGAEKILPLFFYGKKSQLSNTFNDFLDIGRVMMEETAGARPRMKRNVISEHTKKYLENNTNMWKDKLTSDNKLISSSSNRDYSNFTESQSKLNFGNSFSSNTLQNLEETVQALEHKSVLQNEKEQFLNSTQKQLKRDVKDRTMDEILLERNSSSEIPLHMKYFAHNNADEMKKLSSSIEISSQAAESFQALERKPRSVFFNSNLFNNLKISELSKPLLVNEHENLNRDEKGKQLQINQELEARIRPSQFLSPLQSKISDSKTNVNFPTFNSDAFKKTVINPLQKGHLFKNRSFGIHKSINNIFKEGENLLNQVKDKQPIFNGEYHFGGVLSKDAPQKYYSVQNNIHSNKNVNKNISLSNVEYTKNSLPKNLKENFIIPKDKIFNKDFAIKMLHLNPVKDIRKALINQLNIQSDKDLRTDLSKIQDEIRNSSGKKTDYENQNIFDINIKNEIDLNSPKVQINNIIKRKANSENKRHAGNAYTEDDISTNQEKDNILRTNQINSDQNVTKQISNVVKKSLINEKNDKSEVSNSVVRKQDSNFLENKKEGASKQNENLPNTEAIEESRVRNIAKNDDEFYKSPKDEKKRDIIFRSFASRDHFRHDVLNDPMEDYELTLSDEKITNLRKFKKPYKKNVNWYNSKHLRRNNHYHKKEKPNFLNNNYGRLEHAKNFSPLRSTLKINAHINFPNQINIPGINMKNSKSLFGTLFSMGEGFKKKYGGNHFGNRDTEQRDTYGYLMPSSLRKYTNGPKTDKQSHFFLNESPFIRSTLNEKLDNTRKSEKLFSGPLKKGYLNKKNIDLRLRTIQSKNTPLNIWQNRNNRTSEMSRSNIFKETSLPYLNEEISIDEYQNDKNYLVTENGKTGDTSIKSNKAFPPLTVKENYDSVDAEKNKKIVNEILNLNERKVFDKNIPIMKKISFGNNAVKSENKNDLISSFGNLFHAIKTKSKSILSGLWNGLITGISGKEKVLEQKTPNSKLFPEASNYSNVKSIPFQFKPQIEPDISSKHIKEHNGDEERIKFQYIDERLNRNIPPFLDVRLKKMWTNSEVENKGTISNAVKVGIHKKRIAYNEIASNSDEATETMNSLNIPVQQDNVQTRNSLKLNYLPFLYNENFQEASTYLSQNLRISKLRIKTEIESKEKLEPKYDSKIIKPEISTIDFQNATSAKFILNEIKTNLPLVKVPTEHNSSEEENLMKKGSISNITYLRNIFPETNPLEISTLNKSKMSTKTEGTEIIIIQDNDKTLHDLPSRDIVNALNPNLILKEDKRSLNHFNNPIEQDHSYGGKSLKGDSFLNNNYIEDVLFTINPLENSGVSKTGIKAEPVNQKILLIDNNGSILPQKSGINIHPTIYSNIFLDENQPKISPLNNSLNENYLDEREISREDNFAYNNFVENALPVTIPMENSKAKKQGMKIEPKDMKIILLKDENRSNIYEISDKYINITIEPKVILLEDHKAIFPLNNLVQQDGSHEKESLKGGFVLNNKFIKNILPVTNPLGNSKIKNPKLRIEPDDKKVILLKGSERSTIPDISNIGNDTTMDPIFFLSEVKKSFNPFNDLIQKYQYNKGKSYYIEPNFTLNEDHKIIRPSNNPIQKNVSQDEESFRQDSSPNFFFEDALPVKNPVKSSGENEVKFKNIVLFKANDKNFYHGITDRNDTVDTIDTGTTTDPNLLLNKDQKDFKSYDDIIEEYISYELPKDGFFLNNFTQDPLFLRNLTENSGINILRTDPGDKKTILLEDGNKSTIPEISDIDTGTSLNTNLLLTENRKVYNFSNDPVHQDHSQNEESLKEGSFLKSKPIKDSVPITNLIQNGSKMRKLLIGSNPKNKKRIQFKHRETNSDHEKSSTGIEIIRRLNSILHNSGENINFINRTTKQSNINEKIIMLDQDNMIPRQFLEEIEKLKKGNAVSETSNKLNFRNDRENNLDANRNSGKPRYYILFPYFNCPSNKSENNDTTRVILLFRNKTSVTKNGTNFNKLMEEKNPMEKVYVKERQLYSQVFEPNKQKENKKNINEFQNLDKSVENRRYKPFHIKRELGDNVTIIHINVIDDNTDQVSKHQIMEINRFITNNDLNEREKHHFLTNENDNFSNFDSVKHLFSNGDKSTKDVIHLNHHNISEVLQRIKKEPKTKEYWKTMHDSKYDSNKVVIPKDYLSNSGTTFYSSADFNQEISATEEYSEIKLNETAQNYTQISKNVVFSNVYLPNGNQKLENSSDILAVMNRPKNIIDNKHVLDTSSVEQKEPDLDKLTEIIQSPIKKNNIISDKNTSKIEAEFENSSILIKKINERENIEDIKSDVIDSKFSTLHTSQETSTKEYKVTTFKNYEMKFDFSKKLNQCISENKYPRREINSKAESNYISVTPRNKEKKKFDKIKIESSAKNNSKKNEKNFETGFTPEIETEIIKVKNQNLEKNVSNPTKLIDETSLFINSSKDIKKVTEEINKIESIQQNIEINSVDSSSKKEEKKVRTLSNTDEMKVSEDRKGILNTNIFVNQSANLDDEVILRNLEHKNVVLMTSPEIIFNGESTIYPNDNGKNMQKSFSIIPVSVKPGYFRNKIVTGNDPVLESLNQLVVSVYPDKISKIENGEDFRSEVPEYKIDNESYNHLIQESKISPRFIGKSPSSEHSGYFNNKHWTFTHSLMKNPYKSQNFKNLSKITTLDNNHDNINKRANVIKYFMNNKNLESRQKITQFKNQILNDGTKALKKSNTDSSNENAFLKNIVQSSNEIAEDIYKTEPKKDITESESDKERASDNFENETFNIENVVKNTAGSPSNSVFFTDNEEKFIGGLDMDLVNKASSITETIPKKSFKDNLAEIDIDGTHEDSSRKHVTSTGMDFFSIDSSEDSIPENDVDFFSKDSSENNMLENDTNLSSERASKDIELNINTDLSSDHSFDDMSETEKDLSNENNLIQDQSTSYKKQVAPCCKQASKVLKLLSGRKNKTFSKNAVKCFCTYCSKFFSSLGTNPFEEQSSDEKREDKSTGGLSPKVYWTRAMWLTLQCMKH
ncbi:uncharacterized protein NPIL_401541 [Nephila pilipes]|uniref:Uncharacterized protein n=1 Tax=Nephila pilipes TaxID=299642 RepID=A0A8X6UA28_NEPPI|nr:uncharacterized protein NPIL_401541 [Nephila pilipes]